ncbi:MAG: RnfABCDGE type electron transport complex subunit D [Clostridia bacterium]|nr:RnfABCDGE type electron transport complex subunit D [Clostridia bacterium]
MNTALNLSSSPHVRDKWSTAFIMRVVALSLLPATLIGVVVNGIHALLVVLCAVIAAVASEFCFDKLCHKGDTWKDGSAVVTGLMLALSLSPTVPLSMPIIGSVFAIIVVKCCFGGLGKNFLNPALAARCFLLISFGRTMSTYQMVDGISAATPVAMLKSGEAVNITSMFLGTANGVIGGSVLALLVGGLALWALDIIHGQICFSVLAAFTLFMGLFGGQGFDPHFLLAHLCGGGVVMGAFFMATDYVTSPVGRLGQTVYGVLIGALGALFRIKGGAADSFSYSVISANLFVPLIDMYVIPRPFAFRKIANRPMADTRPFYKRIPKPVVVLTVITLIAGVALSGVYTMTKDTIEDQKRAASAASYKVVVPDADHFDVDEAIDRAVADLNGAVYGTSFGRAYINEAFVGKTESDEIAGYAISVTTADGFDGNITLAVGLSPDGTVNGISFTELNETPGMGMRVDEPEFKDQFAGKAVSKFTLNKAGGSTEDDQIDTVSGASTTSGAVVNAVNAALDFFQNAVKGGNA